MPRPTPSPLSPASSTSKRAVAALALGILGVVGWSLWKQSNGSPPDKEGTILSDDNPNGFASSGIAGTPAIAVGGNTTGGTYRPPSPEQEAANNRISLLEAKIATAFRKETRVHIRMELFDSHKKREIWRDGKLFRDETDDRVFLGDGSRNWLWYPKLRRGFVWRRHSAAQIRNLTPVNTESSLANATVSHDEYRRGLYPKGAFRIPLEFGDLTKVSTSKGSELINVPTTSLMRREFIVEPDSLRPIQEIFKTDRTVFTIYGTFSDGRMRTALKATARYGEIPPEGIFRFTPPSGATIVDVDEVSDRWMTRVKTNPGIVLWDKGRTVVRDAQVGKGGEVFLLYTGNALQPYLRRGEFFCFVEGKPIAVRDDLGQTYEPLHPETTTGTALLLDKPFEKQTIQFAIFGPKQKGGALPHFLELTSEAGTKSVRIPLPAPLSTEFPEYATALAPETSFTGTKIWAQVRKITFLTDELKKGKPIPPSAVREIETVVSQNPKEQFTWETTFKLGKLDRAIGDRAGADRRFLEAIEKFRKSYPDTKIPLPSDLAQERDRLEP